MGQGMARALLSAGHTVIVYNRTREKAEPLGAAGATIADRVADACRGDAVLTMLADDAAVEQVVWGDGGILASLAPATAHVSMSTISPRLAARLTDAHGERGQPFVSAPVLGRPEAAARGELAVVAAGDPAAIDPLRPLFDAVGSRTLVVGAIPAGANLIKIACNAMIATVIEGLAETYALVAKSELVDPGAYVDVLLSTVLATPIYRPYGEHVRDGDFTPGFRMPLGLKDIELLLGAGEDHRVPLPLASLLRDHMLVAIAGGLGDLDWAALALVAQAEAGLPAR